MECELIIVQVLLLNPLDYISVIGVHYSWLLSRPGRSRRPRQRITQVVTLTWLLGAYNTASPRQFWGLMATTKRSLSISRAEAREAPRRPNLIEG